MAIFRPDPKSDKRWLFNILHFVVGLLAHLSAGTAKYRINNWITYSCNFMFIGDGVFIDSSNL